MIKDVAEIMEKVEDIREKFKEARDRL